MVESGKWKQWQGLAAAQPFHVKLRVGDNKRNNLWEKRGGNKNGGGWSSGGKKAVYIGVAAAIWRVSYPIQVTLNPPLLSPFPKIQYPLVRIDPSATRRRVARTPKFCSSKSQQSGRLGISREKSLAVSKTWPCLH